ncbi:unnamed protein product [Phytophthora fragariaefolia]|uniref:Unnamed protein product n=1 Tax=Phytophthora fragariaefolia TaxID=1490495 RepID=A0A9W6YHT9_9STRA|nr:unnamed protein product [Phytophthora fragariaefolia]
MSSLNQTPLLKYWNNLRFPMDDIDISDAINKDENRENRCDDDGDSLQLLEDLLSLSWERRHEQRSQQQRVNAEPEVGSVQILHDIGDAENHVCAEPPEVEPHGELAAEVVDPGLRVPGRGVAHHEEVERQHGAPEHAERECGHVHPAEPHVQRHPGHVGEAGELEPLAQEARVVRREVEAVARVEAVGEHRHARQYVDGHPDVEHLQDTSAMPTSTPAPSVAAACTFSNSANAAASKLETSLEVTPTSAHATTSAITGSRPCDSPARAATSSTASRVRYVDSGRKPPEPICSVMVQLTTASTVIHANGLGVRGAVVDVLRGLAAEQRRAGLQRLEGPGCTQQGTERVRRLQFTSRAALRQWHVRLGCQQLVGDGDDDESGGDGGALHGAGADVGRDELDARLQRRGLGRQPDERPDGHEPKGDVALVDDGGQRGHGQQRQQRHVRREREVVVGHVLRRDGEADERGGARPGEVERDAQLAQHVALELEARVAALLHNVRVDREEREPQHDQHDGGHVHELVGEEDDPRHVHEARHGEERAQRGGVGRARVEGGGGPEAVDHHRGGHERVDEAPDAEGVGRRRDERLVAPRHGADAARRVRVHQQLQRIQRQVHPREQRRHIRVVGQIRE